MLQNCRSVTVYLSTWLLVACESRKPATIIEQQDVNSSIVTSAASDSANSEQAYEDGSEPVKEDSIVVDFDGKLQQVSYERHGALDIVEGDIIIRDRTVPEEQGLLGHVRVGRTWPNATVPYLVSKKLSEDSNLNANVTQAIAHWEAVTPIRFVKRDKQPDYVEFIIGDKPTTASSAVGRTGKHQYIRLGTQTRRRNAIHEIGHAMGLFHEHNRRDRDSSIVVRWNNISKKNRKHFKIQLGRPIGPYDFHSRMHYDSIARAVNRRKPTMVPIDRRNVIVNNGFLSPGDIAAIDTLY
jgi:hypothetical protein